MKHYENVFLGLILAGVLMMIIGLGLTMTPASSPDGVRVTFAEKRAIVQASADRLSDDRRPSSKGPPAPPIQ